MEEENKKIILLIIASLVFLFFLILILSLINLIKKQKNIKTNNQSKPTPTNILYTSFSSIKKNIPPTPTSFITPYPLKDNAPVQFTGVEEEEIPKDIQDDTNQAFELRNKLPIDDQNFKINYDYYQDKFVVFLKNKNFKEEDFYQWLKKNYPSIKEERIVFTNNEIDFNNLTSSNLNPNKSPKSSSYNPLDEGLNNSLEMLAEIFKILKDSNYQLNPTQTVSYPTKTISINPSITSFLNPSPTQISNNSQSEERPLINPLITSFLNPSPPSEINNFIFYSQSCYGINSQYCQIPLPGGCTLSKAGCGPTTVTMIIANLTNYKNITPKEIVALYQPSELGCNGSGYLKAKKILNQYGLRTGNLIFYFARPSGKRIEEVINQFKNYQQQGATFFTLAAFKNNSGDYMGHFFWIFKVDEGNNVWSLDPYYGRNTIPYNQNSRYPDPLYELAFPVYKN